MPYLNSTAQSKFSIILFPRDKGQENLGQRYTQTTDSMPETSYLSHNHCGQKGYI